MPPFGWTELPTYCSLQLSHGAPKINAAAAADRWPGRILLLALAQSGNFKLASISDAPRVGHRAANQIVLTPNEIAALDGGHGGNSSNSNCSISFSWRWEKAVIGLPDQSPQQIAPRPIPRAPRDTKQKTKNAETFDNISRLLEPAASAAGPAACPAPASTTARPVATARPADLAALKPHGSNPAGSQAPCRSCARGQHSEPQVYEPAEDTCQHD